MNIPNLKKELYKHTLHLTEIMSDLEKNLVTESLTRELLWSSSSIHSNLTEAGSAGSKESLRYLSYAIDSCKNSVFWLQLLHDSQKGKEKLIKPLIQEIKKFIESLDECRIKSIKSVNS